MKEIILINNLHSQLKIKYNNTKDSSLKIKYCFHYKTRTHNKMPISPINGGKHGKN